MTPMQDLMGPEPILLPGDTDAEAELLANENPAKVAAAHPSASVAWAALAMTAAVVAFVRRDRFEMGWTR